MLFLNMAWWGILLTSIGCLIGAFLLVFGIIAIYLIIRGKKFNKKNASCVEETNQVKPREKQLDETIE